MNEGPERIDYQETPDVTEVHAAVKREHAEPTVERLELELHHPDVVLAVIEVRP